VQLIFPVFELDQQVSFEAGNGLKTKDLNKCNWIGTSGWTVTFLFICTELSPCQNALFSVVEYE
jgi:hypothetical protein